MGKNQKTQDGGGRRGKSLGREFSAGGVVYKDDLWLIINPTDTDRWQLPKGRIEGKDSSKETAIREVKEEGGVEARARLKLGEQKYFFYWDGKKILKTVIFYLMEYVSGDTKDHDQEVTEALFLPYKDALVKLTFKNDKEMLKKALEALSDSSQPSLLE